MKNLNKQQKRVLCRVQKMMKKALKPYIFESNTEINRKKLKECIEKTLFPLHAKFKIDNEKSTKDIIVGDLTYTLPNYISIDFTITDKGAIINN